MRHPVSFRPVMHIRAEDPLFGVIEQDLRSKIEFDAWLRKRVRFGGQNGSKPYINILGSWGENGILDRPPLVVEDDGWPRDWEFSIQVWGDVLAVVYNRQGRIARPFFDGPVTTNTDEKRKRAYRLRSGCWVILISRSDGRITLLEPYLFSENDRTGWGVESRIIGYTEDPEASHRLFCSASEAPAHSRVRPYYATETEDLPDQEYLPGQGQDQGADDPDDPNDDPTDVGSIDDYYAMTRSGQKALARKSTKEGGISDD